MNQRELKKLISEKKLENLYIFCGEDYFLKNIYLERIANAKGYEIEKTTVETKEELEEIVLKAQSSSLFRKKPMVIYCSVPLELDKIEIKQPKHNVLILDLQKCSKKLPNSVHFENPTKEEIAKYIQIKAKINKKIITKDALNFLVELFTGFDTGFMENTLNAIVLFCKDKPSIGLEDVKNIVPTDKKFDIKELFKLLNRADFETLNKNVEKILMEIPIQLFVYLMADSFIKIYVSCFLNERAFSKLFKGYYTTYRKICEKLGKEKIRKILEDLHELDFLVKSSNSENIDTLIKTKIFEWSQKWKQSA